MSYTIVKGLWLGENADPSHCILMELRNSWASAPVIWDAICKRYLGRETWFQADNADLWAAWQREEIPKAYRAVLMMTLDRCYVLKKDFARAAADIEEFVRWADCPQSHWPAIARILRADPDCDAVGLWCTTVAADPFDNGPCDEDGETGPPDRSEWYNLYADLDDGDEPKTIDSAAS